MELLVLVVRLVIQMGGMALPKLKRSNMGSLVILEQVVGVLVVAVETVQILCLAKMRVEMVAMEAREDLAVGVAVGLVAGRMIKTLSVVMLTDMVMEGQEANGENLAAVVLRVLAVAVAEMGVKVAVVLV